MQKFILIFTEFVIGEKKKRNIFPLNIFTIRLLLFFLHDKLNRSENFSGVKSFRSCRSFFNEFEIFKLEFQNVFKVFCLNLQTIEKALPETTKEQLQAAVRTEFGNGENCGRFGVRQLKFL